MLHRSCRSDTDFLFFSIERKKYTNRLGLRSKIQRARIKKSMHPRFCVISYLRFGKVWLFEIYIFGKLSSSPFRKC